MPRARIGPLAVESPLGGVGSNVYRALHIQRRVPLAVRLLPIPLGMTPEAKRDFAQQLERLKQLKHPGIARCLGGGFDDREAYLVYELVDGMSLAELLERRQRLPWEECLRLAMQLCDALHAAHQAGWVHGSLRPSKLLLTTDGERCLISDFRRRDTACNMLDEPPRGDQLRYLAPEQLVDPPRLLPASDLYGLGAILYQLLTGQPPPVRRPPSGSNGTAASETAAVPLPPVASVVFDCPIWLSSVVEQLLYEDPRERPYSPQAARLALGEARRRAEQGIGVAQHAVSGFSPLKLPGADRGEARRLLLGKAARPHAEERATVADAPALWERPAFLAVALLGLLGIVAWLLWPLSEEQLRAKAEQLMAAVDGEGYSRARQQYLQPMLKRFPDGAHADWAREQLDLIEIDAVRKRLQRYQRSGRAPADSLERDCLLAERYAEFGDIWSADDMYGRILRLAGDDPDYQPLRMYAVGRRQTLSAAARGADELTELLDQKLLAVQRQLSEGQTLVAKSQLEELIELYQRREQAEAWVEEARRRLDKIRP
jgi:eukaryotic-like serine/threonine-protein kinase